MGLLGFDRLYERIYHARVPSRTGKQKINDTNTVVLHPAFSAACARAAA